MTLNRESFLSPKLKIEEVQVEDLGGSVFVKQLTAKDAIAYGVGIGKLMEAAKEAEKDQPIDLRERLLVITVCDEDGKLIFSQEDIALLGEQSPRTVDVLYTAASELNAMADRKKVDEVEKPLPEAPSEP